MQLSYSVVFFKLREEESVKETNKNQFKNQTFYVSGILLKGTKF